ncbi:hypothetical protein KCMC57_up33390 [Kitasatospora sp. CMC57]|uniref:Transcriptional regulator n=1 Tax=Kitasatospora sp. CMC57 TaxID=3231513 RepID=A0AB33K019_9ACTN
MSKDFGRPPRASQNQDLVQQRLKEADSAAGVRESLTIEWHQQPLTVQVIHMPVRDIYYNPATHRIRAQRSHDPARNRKLDEDPWSAESQDYLDFLLRAKPSNPAEDDPAFVPLMESIRDFGQNDPGLITRDGVLVNGNTRRAAMLKLGEQTIRVGVLPESCTWADVSSVELSLQLREDHRRDYSYINKLLAIEEQVALGVPLVRIAKEFRTTAAVCEQGQWILGCIREMISRSSSADAELRLVDFEADQEKLREMHRRYFKEAATSRDSAEVIRESRMAAIMLGFSKTDVRLIEEDFQSRYLEHRLPAELKAAQSAPTVVAIPGLNRSVRGSAPKVLSARAFTDSILKAKAVESAGEKVPAAQVAEAARLLKAAGDAMEDALEPAGKDARIRKRKQAAPDRLMDAAQDIEQCITDLVLARGSRSLDEEAFDEAVVKLRHTLGKLAKEAARNVAEPGDGVAWLLDVVRGES